MHTKPCKDGFYNATIPDKGSWALLDGMGWSSFAQIVFRLDWSDDLSSEAMCNFRLFQSAAKMYEILKSCNLQEARDLIKYVNEGEVVNVTKVEKLHPVS